MSSRHYVPTALAFCHLPFTLTVSDRTGCPRSGGSTLTKLAVTFGIVYGTPGCPLARSPVQ